MSKRYFIVAGEASGDELGAWYVRRLKQTEPDAQFFAVGGAALKEEGAELFMHLSELSFVGVTEILKNLFHIFSLLRSLASHIAREAIDEVVVVDFPGFNLRLIRMLKKMGLRARITYLSPPQLWVWGSFRVSTIRRFCDDVVVLYPFEVAWYAKRGVKARWLGYPWYKNFLSHFKSDMEHKRSHIALLPGSRKSETSMLFPFFAQTVQKLRERFPDLSFVLLGADTLSDEFFEQQFACFGMPQWRTFIHLVRGDEKYAALAESVLAISKPGTGSLHAGLLGVPTIVLYKTSWFTYMCARMVVSVSYMGLANLLLGREVSPEYIQHRCIPAVIAQHAGDLYESYMRREVAYEQALAATRELRDLLAPRESVK